MPLDVQAVVGGSAYASPMVGPVDHVVHGKLDVSGLTIADVDEAGYLKPGLPLKSVGGLLVLIGGAAAAPLIVHEAIKLPLAVIPPTDVSLAAVTNDPLIAVATHGIVNLDIAEDNLGRVYTANEKTSFVTAGSHLALTTT